MRDKFLELLGDFHKQKTDLLKTLLPGNDTRKMGNRTLQNGDEVYTYEGRDAVLFTSPALSSKVVDKDTHGGLLPIHGDFVVTLTTKYTMLNGAKK